MERLGSELILSFIRTNVFNILRLLRKICEILKWANRFEDKTYHVFFQTFPNFPLIQLISHFDKKFHILNTKWLSKLPNGLIGQNLSVVRCKLFKTKVFSKDSFYYHLGSSFESFAGFKKMIMVTKLMRLGGITLHSTVDSKTKLEVFGLTPKYFWLSGSLL